MSYIDFKSKKKVKIFEGINGSLSHSDNITFGHITLEKGVNLPEHKHVHEQWTHVIEGKLLFIVGGEEKILTPGMAAYIPSNVPHSGKAITGCKVIDCFTPVRDDFIELEKKTK
ncbi:MAG: cupin domain-containing protein [Bacteroidales bacterium]|nr:cupin domain-containing protein [Bacteroidales bacterium]